MKFISKKRCYFALVFANDLIFSKTMSYIKFDKKQLVNLNYALDKELLRTNRKGGYASSSIIGCNTRKYHGLLVVPQKQLDNDKHVLLSTIDETLILNGQEFHLSIRKYPGGVYLPKGHKYIRDFTSEPNMKLTYRLGTTVFHKEYIFARHQDRILIKYTLEDSAATEVVLKLKPFLAFRNYHMLSRSNLNVNTKFLPCNSGVSWQMYQGYERLYMQFSKENNYVHVPDWNFNIEYYKEQERGYEYQEDLFVPGFFELKIKKGESIVLSSGTEERNPEGFMRRFREEIKHRIPRNSFENCLRNAAEEFILKIGNITEVVAGYHWFRRWGRDTFVALPGITLGMANENDFHRVIRSMIKEASGCLFPNTGYDHAAAYNSVDTTLWFFRALHKYYQMTGNHSKVWKTYGKTIKEFLKIFKEGKCELLMLHDNGLLWARKEKAALTWMDAVVDGNPVTQRGGYAVEINALWYDALHFFLHIAEKEKDNKFLKEWSDFPALIKKSFLEVFWSEDKGYLADYVDDTLKDFAVRPNMIFALSETYSPLSEYQKESILYIVEKNLLTPYGLRSLSPQNYLYKGSCQGDLQTRDKAYHNGTIWPWLMGPFAEAYLKQHRKTGKRKVKELYQQFEKQMNQNGIGTISEIYDGDPPYKAGGTISQAWSVGELLRINWMLQNTKKLYKS